MDLSSSTGRIRTRMGSLRAGVRSSGADLGEYFYGTVDGMGTMALCK